MSLLSRFASLPSRRLRTRGPTLALVAIWTVGLIALGAVIEFQQRLDAARRGQVVIAQIHNQQGALLGVAFSPATAGKANAPSEQQTARELAQAQKTLDGSVAALARLGHSDAPARIAALTKSYSRFVDRLSVLVNHGKSGPAALASGASERPGGITAALTDELARADNSYGADATRSKIVASIGTITAILSLLLAFSIVFQHSVRARRRSQRDASTDALTGLGNRRKLFADMEHTISGLHGDDTVAIGIFDLDGFKAYNDTFGHPAGDALLTRLGTQLAAAVGAHGSCYRIGGDEFVVTTTAADQQLLIAARSALTDSGTGFSIGCSLGTTEIHAGTTLEQALHIADLRLYSNKRSTRDERRTDVKDALLQVLSEQDKSLVTHLGHVAALAESTAVGLRLPPDQIELTRLAAELHDIGKAAIPEAILNKPGPLTAAERTFMQTHSLIGERIVAAAAALAPIAPIIRAAHERPDGTGYPDGLNLEQIPICSRIIAVVDAYDAMTSDRPYRRARPPADALAELALHAGSQFDPDVVDAFTAVCRNTRATTADGSAPRETPIAA